MDVKEIKFDTIYDVSLLFKKKSVVTEFGYGFIDHAKLLFEKENVQVVVWNKSVSFAHFAFDINFILESMLITLNKLDISENEVMKFHNLFKKETDDKSQKHWILLSYYFYM